jgi:hypothetical protein
MPREIRFPPARSLTVLVALVGLTTVLFAVVSAPAQAAKPCWERVMDDWTDNGLIEGDYSASCIAATRRHVPEDLRSYTDILDKLDSYRQTTGRTLQSAGGTGPQSGTGATPPSRGEEPEPSANANGKDEGPISVVLGKGTTDASSIPLPLIVLAGLALALMAAGGVGVAHRKLAARKIRSRS